MEGWCKELQTRQIQYDFFKLVSEYENDHDVLTLDYLKQFKRLIEGCYQYEDMELLKTIQDYYNEINILYQTSLLLDEDEDDEDDDSSSSKSLHDEEPFIPEMSHEDRLEEARQRMEQELHDRLAQANIMEEHMLRLQERMNPIEKSAPLKKLDPTLIQFIYEQEIHDECDCSICLQSANPSVQLKCGHGYHASCIIAWIKRDYSCPYCRQKFEL